MTPTGSAAGDTAAPRRRPFVVAAICATSLACVMFDQTALVVAASTIGRELDAGISGLQWLTAILSLVAASTMPVSGVLGARYGARNVLQAGLLVFASGALVAATAGGLAQLIAARAVQGLGVALILPSGATLLGRNVPAGRPRQTAVAAWVVLGSTGLLLGPLLGGVMAQGPGWRFTFWALVPVVLIACALDSLLLNTPRSRPGRLDLAGLATVCLALATLSWVLIETGRGSAPASWIVAGFAVSLALFGLFLLVERRAENPVLDTSVLWTPNLRLVLPAALTYNSAINGSAFVLSLYLQQDRGFSPSTTGLMLLAANLGMPLAGPVTNYLSRFARPTTLMLASLIGLTLSFALMALPVDLPVWALLIPMIALGLAAGVLYSVDTVAVLDGTEGAQAAPAMAALALARQIGTVLGIAALASIGQVAVTSGITDRGGQFALLAAGIITSVMIYPLWRYARTHGRPA